MNEKNLYAYYDLRAQLLMFDLGQKNLKSSPNFDVLEFS